MCKNIGAKLTQENTSIESDIAAAQNTDWDNNLNKEESNDVKTIKRNCPSHEIGFSVDETKNELDIPEENISTLLCYLELHDQQYVKILSKAYIRCKVYSYGGPKILK